MHVVGWTNPSPGRTDLQLTNIVPGTVQRSGSEQLVSVVGEAMTFAALVGKRAGGAASDEALLAYRRFVIATGNATLHSQRYRAFGGGPVTTLLPGCGNGGTCSANGPAALGNAQFAVRLAGADPAAQFGLMFADVLAQPTYGCGSCTRIEAMFSFFAVPVGGAAQIALPLPGSTAYLGLRLDAQWLTISPSSSPCAVVPGVVLSNAIRIVLAD